MIGMLISIEVTIGLSEENVRLGGVKLGAAAVAVGTAMKGVV